MDAVDLATAAGIQISITLAVLLLFSWLRLHRFTRRFYAPKRFDKAQRVKPRRLPPTLLSWWLHVWRTSEEDVIAVNGLDAAMFLRVLRFATEVSAYVTLWCLVVVLPANLTGQEVQRQLAQQAAQQQAAQQQAAQQQAAQQQAAQQQAVQQQQQLEPPLHNSTASPLLTPPLLSPPPTSPLLSASPPLHRLLLYQETALRQHAANFAAAPQEHLSGSSAIAAAAAPAPAASLPSGAALAPADAVAAAASSAASAPAGAGAAAAGVASSTPAAPAAAAAAADASQPIAPTLSTLPTRRGSPGAGQPASVTALASPLEAPELRPLSTRRGMVAERTAANAEAGAARGAAHAGRQLLDAPGEAAPTPPEGSSGGVPLGLTPERLNATAGRGTVQCYEVPVIQTIPRQLSSIDLCSVTNLERGSSKLWVHVVSLYVVTAIVLRAMWRYTQEASLLRVLYVANTPRGGCSHTVLVTDIPGMNYGTLRWSLRKLLSRTVLAVLPKRHQTRVLDWLERWFTAVANGLSLSKALARRLQDGARSDDGLLVDTTTAAANQLQSPPPPSMLPLHDASLGAPSAATLSPLTSYTVHTSHTSHTPPAGPRPTPANSGPHLGSPYFHTSGAGGVTLIPHFHNQRVPSAQPSLGPSSLTLSSAAPPFLTPSVTSGSFPRGRSHFSGSGGGSSLGPPVLSASPHGSGLGPGGGGGAAEGRLRSTLSAGSSAAGVLPGQDALGPGVGFRAGLGLGSGTAATGTAAGATGAAAAPEAGGRAGREEDVHGEARGVSAGGLAEGGGGDRGGGTAGAGLGGARGSGGGGGRDSGAAGAAAGDDRGSGGGRGGGGVAGAGVNRDSGGSGGGGGANGVAGAAAGGDVGDGPRLLLTPRDLSVWGRARAELGELGEGEVQLERLKAFVLREFESCYGEGQVAAVNPVWDQRKLEGICADIKSVSQSLQDYLDKLAYKLRRRRPINKRRQVTVVGPAYGTWGVARYGLRPVKVDAITFWCERLRELMSRLEVAQREALTRPVPSAFITFNSRSAQAHAASSLHHHDETAWRTQPAPEPGEVLWGSLRTRLWLRAVLSVFMWAAYLALLLFFTIPVVLVQGLIQVDQLATYPVLRDFVNAPVINQILQGILPSLVLLLFLALVPSILHWMCIMSGLVSLSQVDRGVVTRYFYFQVITVFFYNMVAGSIVNQLKAIIAAPSSLLNTLGLAVPQTATFFITYVLTAGIGKAGINFLRLPQLLLFWLLARLASTPRAVARLWEPQYLMYGPIVPSYTTMLFLGLVYCTINPLICPALCLFFAVESLLQRYNMLYVYRGRYEAGGRVWSVVVHQFMAALYCMQVFMIVLLSLKGFGASPVLAPLVLGTFAFHVALVVLFRRPWSLVSVHDAAMLDRLDQAARGKSEMSPQELDAIQSMYLSPVFKVPLGETQALLREAAIMSLRVDGRQVGLEELEQIDGVAWEAAQEEWDAPQDTDMHDHEVNAGSAAAADGPFEACGGHHQRGSSQQQEGVELHGVAHGYGAAGSAGGVAGVNGV